VYYQVKKWVRYKKQIHLGVRVQLQQPRNEHPRRRRLHEGRAAITPHPSSLLRRTPMHQNMSVRNDERPSSGRAVSGSATAGSSATGVSVSAWSGRGPSLCSAMSRS
jgi:hypothetical protein